MRTLPFLAIALLVAGALAGCADNDGGDGAGGTTTPTGSTTPTTTSPDVTPTPTTPGGVDPTPTIDSVTVGTDAAYPPFENQENGEIVGFDVDVMKEVGNRSGFTVKFENALFDAIIPAVQNGQFDAGMSAFTINDERKQQVDFSVSYYENSLMVALASETEGVEAPEDLQGQTACTQKGTTAADWLRDEVGLAEENLLLFDTFPPCADAVTGGDAIAMVIDRAAVRDLVQRSEGDLKEAFVVETDEEFGIAVQKGNNALLVAINAALVQMKQDGTLERLQDKWNV